MLDILSQYNALELHDVIDHDRFKQYAIVHHSSGIEGSALTENETRLLLEEGVTPKGKPLEHSLMVKDHFDALQFTLAAARVKRIPDLALIQEINARVMRHTGGLYNTALGQVDASKGEFRKGNVSAGGSYFISFDKVRDYTQRLVEKLGSELLKANTVPAQLRLAFVSHFDLVSIHPFYDGNGRTSRLLMNYVQEYFGLPLAIVYQQDKSYYYDALVAARKNEDTSVFEDFMVSQYEQFLQQEINQYKQDMSRSLESNKKDFPGKGLSLFF